MDARLTHAVEKVFETVCPHPPAEYLDKLNEDLQKLGQIAAMPDAVHDILHISPAFLVRYGIDKRIPRRNAPVRRKRRTVNWMPVSSG